MSQMELFPVIELESDLITRIVKFLGLNPESWGVDDPYEWEMIDNFVSDCVKDHLRRYEHVTKS